MTAHLPSLACAIWFAAIVVALVIGYHAACWNVEPHVARGLNRGDR